MEKIKVLEMSQRAFNIKKLSLLDRHKGLIVIFHYHLGKAAVSYNVFLHIYFVIGMP